MRPALVLAAAEACGGRDADALPAACAVELGDLDSARRHIEALVILEPDQPRHSKRLEAVERLIARKG